MGIPMVCVAHQYLFLHPDFEMPGRALLPESMLKLFTRITCVGATAKLALSIRQYDDDEKQAIKVVPPLLRKEVKPRSAIMATILWAICSIRDSQRM